MNINLVRKQNIPRRVLAPPFAGVFTAIPPTPLPKPSSLASTLFGCLCLSLGPGKQGNVWMNPWA